MSKGLMQVSLVIHQIRNEIGRSTRRPLCETKMQAELQCRSVCRQHAPGFCPFSCDWTIHQQAGSLQQSFLCQREDGLIGGVAQAEIIGMPAWR